MTDEERQELLKTIDDEIRAQQVLARKSRDPRYVLLAVGKMRGLDWVRNLIEETR